MLKDSTPTWKNFTYVQASPTMEGAHKNVLLLSKFIILPTKMLICFL